MPLLWGPDIALQCDNPKDFIYTFCVFLSQYVCCQYYQWRYLVTTYRSPLVWRVRSCVFPSESQTFNSDNFTTLELWTGLGWSVTICVIMNGPLEPEQSSIWAWRRLAVWIRNPRHKVETGAVEHPGRLIQRQTDLLELESISQHTILST